MQMILDPVFHMWFAIALTFFSILSFAREKIPLEATAVLVMAALLIFGHFFPLMDDQGSNMMNPQNLLAGFANPSLIAILALLIMGQGLMQTEALRPLTKIFITKNKVLGWVALIGLMLFIMTASAFMNNTPLVIIAIPLLQILLNSLGVSESKFMMPLSFIAILGGMTTLIGSSTNLLVSSALVELGQDAISFFEFSIAGAMLAAVGAVYVFLILPKLLPDRSSLSDQLQVDDKEFVTELTVPKASKLIGMEYEEKGFPALKDLKVKLIQRKGHLILPPFEGYSIEEGDTIILSATRKILTEILPKFHDGLIVHDTIENEEEAQAEDEKILCEVMVTPTSRIIDMTVEQASLDHRFGAVVLGIQRRARVVKRRLGRVRLEPGDVLLVAASQQSIDTMSGSGDMIVLKGSIKDMPAARNAWIAAAIFLMTIVGAALGIVTIPVAAFVGSTLMILTGCLNFRQAMRALDRKIFFLVGSMLALGGVLQSTGAADYMAQGLLMFPMADQPLILASLLFILVAFTTNVLTNNACAILFTPIAISLAVNLGIDPKILAYTVIFGANCSFASPIGYQTNLLVMGPGHYKFADFMKSGVPLILIMWVAYTVIAHFYYGLTAF